MSLPLQCTAAVNPLPRKAPRRLRLAQCLCRWLPPIISMRLRSLVYPQKIAFQDGFTFRVRAKTGSMFCGSTSDFHGYLFSVHGYYEWRNWALAASLCSPGDTVLEIGANVGTETVGFRDIVGAQGKVFAFEPAPMNLAALRQLVNLNHWENVHIIPMALGDREGNVSFAMPPDKHSSGVGYVAETTADISSRSIEVQCSRLDALAGMVGAAKMIFCDTEGAETRVLRGANSYIQRHRPAIVLEASPKLLLRAGSSLAELLETVLSAGYRAFAIGRLGLSPISNLTPRRAGNWLCLHASEPSLLKQCSREILRCALLPCIRGLNPLCR